MTKVARKICDNKIPLLWKSLENIPTCPDEFLWAGEFFAMLLRYLFTLKRDGGQYPILKLVNTHRNVLIQYNEIQFGPIYTESVKSAAVLGLLNPGDNPALENTFYKFENLEMISAFERLNFLLCHVVEASIYQTALVSQSEDIGEDIGLRPNGGLVSLLSLIPDPCEIHKCGARNYMNDVSLTRQ